MDDSSRSTPSDAPEPQDDWRDYVFASVRRINRIAEAMGARNYLEIGVETGMTFLALDFETKTGVDPAFQFDWQLQNGKGGVELHQCTSDTFFEKLASEKRYDLMFIDGLHTFEKTYRDILHCLQHAHSGSVLLIDDTVPCDVFSTCRDQNQCLSLRSMHANPDDIRWHGDTYKLIPLLCAFNPDLQFLTLMDQGNPQTVVWKPHEPQPEDPVRTMQAMWAVQNLAAADYLWFLDNLSLYNPVSEQVGLETVIQAIKTRMQSSAEH